MDWTVIERMWTQAKGRIQSKWDKLTSIVALAGTKRLCCSQTFRGSCTRGGGLSRLHYSPILSSRKLGDDLAKSATRLSSRARATLVAVSF
jgi:hypothetical protein